MMLRRFLLTLVVVCAVPVVAGARREQPRPAPSGAPVQAAGPAQAVPAPGTPSTDEQPPATPSAETPVGEALRLFVPSEEISADRSISFPVDI